MIIIIVYILLLFLTLFLYSVTLPLYSRLGQNIGSFWASSLYLMTGTVTLCAWLLIKGEPLFVKEALHLGPVVYINGLINVLVLMGIVMLIPRVGLAFIWATEVMGQISSALIMDTWKIFSPSQIPISTQRIMGVLLIIAGSIIFTLLTKSPKAKGKSAKAWPLWLCFVIGILIGAMQSLMNGVNTIAGMEIGVARALVLYFGMGACLSIILGALFFRKKLIEMLKVKPRYHIPGFVNILLVGIPPLVIPVLGVSVFTGISFLAAAFSTLLVDRIGFLGLTKIPISISKIIGLVIMLIGVITMSL